VRAGQTFAVGAIINLAAILILLMIVGKICSNTFLRPLVVQYYSYFPPFQWAWDWLPNTWDAAFLSGPFVLVICLLFVGSIRMTQARNYFSIVAAAERNSAIEDLMDRRTGRSQQNIGDIIAGGDVTVQQKIAETNRKLDEWDQSFWKGPLGSTVLGVAVVVIGAVITGLVGPTH
jgi:hypothetical protein